MVPVHFTILLQIQHLVFLHLNSTDNKTVTPSMSNTCRHVDESLNYSLAYIDIIIIKLTIFQRDEQVDSQLSGHKED